MPHHPLLLGHRGLRSPAGPQENTIPAFDRALQAGCDGFEFDVRRTSDGHAVICHDANYKGSEVASANRSRVPDLASLEDVLARFAEQAFLDIELKVPGSEVDVVAALRRFRPKVGFVVSSFLPEVLHDVPRADPNIPLGLICDRLSQLNYWPEVSIDYVIPHFALLTRPLLEKLHAAEKKVVVWTVNKPDEMLRYAGWGVDGIVSDIPELLVRTLKKNGR